MTRIAQKHGAIARWLLLAGGLLGCAGCGAGDDDGAGPDGPEADTTAPTIVSSDPADGARLVPALADLTVTFDEDLDEATVSTSTMTLHMAGRLWTFAGTVSYDAATRTATFSPRDALPTQTELTLALAGITDLAGNPTAATTIGFHTYRNPSLQQVQYSTGQVERWTAYLNDDVGDVLRETRYTGAGVDGIWFTSDDAAESYTRFDYDGAKRPTGSTWYATPGDDGIWGNGDDVVGSRSASTYDDEGRLARSTTYLSAGRDLVWSTPDDLVGWYTRHDTGATGVPGGDVSYDDPGIDGVWHTDDDRPSRYTLRIRDGIDRILVYAACDSSGSDGVWFTIDDGCYLAQGSHYPAAGTGLDRLFTTQLSGPGPDGLWATDDDAVIGYDVVTEDPGVLTRSATYDDPGRDQQWRTDDDRVSGHYDTTSFVAKGLAGRSAWYSGVGLDGLWFTADDAVGASSRMTYDAQGHRINYVSYTAPGVDGIWFSADDEPSYASTDDPSR